ncbi:4-alpha-glucanotransferase [Afifella sp. IM 167]|uniref:4-alpha-glucanotransferase n=1 Tax=Afifella sp. IM 167 TaxID=2033586 RepID=UPI001CD02273|nr:4-alpha-glucanotransferase [Afifella sp. IM 167]MBZ8133693.1 4-alpha-glucanotransferase [Afifella sp. IM 167]
MTEELDRLAWEHGIDGEYWALSGEKVAAGDETKRALLAALGVTAGATPAGDELRAKLGGLAGPGRPCFVPPFLAEGRAWGVTCQLYGLNTARNWGIGDFTDLAELAETVAARGADFVGVNPLHALFLAMPERMSPFYPSSRRFLNPLYIAVDQVAGYTEADAPSAEWLGAARAAPLVDYPGVTRHKLAALWRIFQRGRDGILADPAFERFREKGGKALFDHALFEAIALGGHASAAPGGWHVWDEAFRSPGSEASQAYAKEHDEEVLYQMWLQFLAEGQADEAQARALAAGMRIGLYVDLAVGVAPDGSATWTDEGVTVKDVTVGAPPDYFNADGQDWGLAPLSPEGLLKVELAPFRSLLESLMRHAGALRIDHVMGLYRQFWIPRGLGPAKGAYMRFPFAAMLGALADVSQSSGTLVIGEDLGVVPEGFREVMAETALHAYKVFLFERDGERFRDPAEYPRSALACLTTHDTASLAGWWSTHDLVVREHIGLLGEEAAGHERQARKGERQAVLRLLAEHGLGDGLGEMEEGSEAQFAEISLRLHTLIARAPSRLFAVALEDIAGIADQPNVPGTTDAHPNWQRRLPLEVGELASRPHFARILEAVARERPRT